VRQRHVEVSCQAVIQAKPETRITRYGEYPSKEQSERGAQLQPVSLPSSKSGRTVLQQDQALQASGYSLRQARGQLPRIYPTCVH